MFKVSKLVSLGLLAFAGLACAEEFPDEQHNVHEGLKLEKAMSSLKQQQVQFAELANLLKTFASADEIEIAYRNLGGGPDGADDVLPLGKDDAALCGRSWRHSWRAPARRDRTSITVIC